jgi:hypothetical protein
MERVEAAGRLAKIRREDGVSAAKPKKVIQAALNPIRAALGQTLRLTNFPPFLFIDDQKRRVQQATECLA